MWHKLQEIKFVQKLMEKEMFHKALWMRNYKQGKVVIWLMWIISFLALPLLFVLEAHNLTSWMNTRHWSYSYRFSYITSLLPLGSLVILLACILTGLERTNQGEEFIFALPFKRRSSFLSKWLLGAIHITVITLINMLLMFFIQQTTIHAAFQTFTPFLNFFFVMFMALLATYSLALFIGTFTGGFISQVFLTIVVCTLPWFLVALLDNFIFQHNAFPNFNINLPVFLDISIFSVLIPSFWFIQSSSIARTQFQQFDYTSLATYIALLIYLVGTTYLGVKLCQQTPNENKGKIIMHKKFEPIFIWFMTIFITLLGGTIGSAFFWNIPLLSFYITGILSGIACYLILSKFMQRPLRIKKANV